MLSAALARCGSLLTHSRPISTTIQKRSPTSGIPFNFGYVYGNDRGYSAGFECTRRVWRVFTLAAPSLLATLSPYTDGLGTFGYGEGFKQPYPFSVKVGCPT